MKSLLLALLLTQAPALKAAGAEEPFATAVEISGEVTVDAGDGKLDAVELGELVAEGDTIRTGEGGSAHLLLSDGSSVILGPNTEMKISALKKEESFFDLVKGAVNAIVERLSEGSRFEVRTAHTVAAVKGTEFEVSAGTEESLVTVQEGEVSMSDPEHKRIEQVLPGHRGAARRGRLDRPFKLSKRDWGAFEDRWRRHRLIHGQRAELMKHFREKQKERRERLKLRRERLKKNGAEGRDRAAIKDRRKAAKERFEKAREDIRRERLKR